MRSVSLVVRLWWEPGWGVRAAVRPAHGGPPVYLNNLEELTRLLERHAGSLSVQVVADEESATVEP